jgi:hypothetical protein
VKNSWRKVKGHWYFLKKSGKAAVGPCKVTRGRRGCKKGTRCVFDSKGRLLTGSKTRNVKVAGKLYRVTARGIAAGGWNRLHTVYAYSNGEIATGVRVVGSKLFAASSSGVYNAALTSKLRSAALEGGDASALLSLLGTPLKTIAGLANCSDIAGEAVVYRYAHIEVSTVRTPEGTELLLSYDEL